jgi:hypothetical protein
MEGLGAADQPGSKGQYADVPIHAGLVCINGPSKMTARIQLELLAAVLDEIQSLAHLVNEVIEVSLSEESGEFEIVRYSLPDANETEQE